MIYDSNLIGVSQVADSELNRSGHAAKSRNHYHLNRDLQNGVGLDGRDLKKVNVSGTQLK